MESSFEEVVALLTSPNVQRVDSLIAEELDTYVDAVMA